VYRLPKEVEWEYACRGGPMSDRLDSAFDFYFDKPVAQLLPDQANVEHGKGLKRTCKVGSYRPNRLGLYDLHGNVGEWCEDEVKDDKGASRRVVRGGTFVFYADLCRASDRAALWLPFRAGDVGLRLARVPVGKEIVKIAAEEKKPPVVEGKLPPKFTNSLGMEFVLIPKGKAWLGGGGGNPGNWEVEIARDFYLGKYEVTQEEWEKVTGTNPSGFKGVPAITKRLPVENVSWDDCQAFIKRVNEQVKEAGWVYRLPTEMEWEYACRGGPMKDRFESAFDFYFAKPTNTLLPDQANFEHGKGLKRTCKVGSYHPNRLGLYDMHGNVWEWCHDQLKDDKGASRRVYRGGSWFHIAGECGAAVRNTQPPSDRHSGLGLRLARVPVGKEIVKTAVIAPTEEQLRQRIEAAWPGLGKRLSKDKAGNYTLDLGRGPQIADLTPLKGMPLTRLYFNGNEVLEDLTPLQGMKLKWLGLGWCHKVKDLRPLQGMELDFLDLAQGWGADLSHLKGMRIRHLSIWNGASNASFRALQGVQLTILVAGYSPIDDLTPLRGTAITELNLDHCDRLADLTPLKGMPLEKLYIQGCDKIVDVTPLKDLPLKEIVCDFKPARDAAVFQAIKTLVTINGKPAAEFWKGQKNAPAKQVEQPSPQRIPAVAHYGGDWRLEGDELLQGSADQNLPTSLSFGDTSWTDYDVSVEARRIKGAGLVILFFRTENFLNGWEYRLLGQDRVRDYKTRNDGVGTVIDKKAWIWDENWHKIAVKARGDHLEWYLDGRLDFKLDDSRHPRGGVGLWTWKTSVRFKNLRVTDARGGMLVDGVGSLDLTGGRGIARGTEKFVAGTIWKGKVESTDKAKDEYVSDAILKVLKRDGATFEGQFWVDKERLGLKVKGNVDQLGDLSWRPTAILAGGLLPQNLEVRGGGIINNGKRIRASTLFHLPNRDLPVEMTLALEE
jgi:formylglycine-generating enzyme required for sulfatase activity